MSSAPQDDVLVQAINALQVKCPVHDSPMLGERVEIKVGLDETPIKIMYVGKCAECSKWFEYLPPDAILWP